MLTLVNIRRVARLLPACCLLLLSFQPDDYKLINSIPFSRAKFATDRLGNAYVIADNQLLEFDTLGKPKVSYSNFDSGIISSVDASNPLKILLFYPDFARIELLNN